jgi:hypothetical protein
VEQLICFDAANIWHKKPLKKRSLPIFRKIGQTSKLVASLFYWAKGFSSEISKTKRPPSLNL